jgi:hypothetical protein
MGGKVLTLPLSREERGDAFHPSPVRERKDGC